MIARFGLGSLLICAALVRAASGEGLALLVPAYFEPETGHWKELAAAARRVPIVAIANIFNGPGLGGQSQPEYVSALRDVREAGGQVLGYVYTGYGQRPLVAVKADMALWQSLYPLDGFFVDEMANSPTQALLAYYSEIFRYARQLNPAYRVTGNPGTSTAELYLKEPTADVLVLFENDTGYPNFVPPSWTTRYPEYQFGHLTYSVPTAEQMTSFVQLAVNRRAGFMYVTNDSGGNPWDTLPSYWAAEVDLVESLNQAAAERLQSKLVLSRDQGPLLSLTAQGAVGRYVLETASPLGSWRPASTNLTHTGNSVWQILNLPPNRFFRIRQE